MPPVGRRAFLASLGAALAACAGSGGKDVAALRASLDPSLVCDDVHLLWPAELATRTTNAYVDHSAKPAQFCLICQNFQAPPDLHRCGTCVTVKGPISPGGWCKSWTAKRT
ncbi:MAG TPA: hypothetical protein VFV75_03520 [Candidatus Polarisedimenticolaceae bacterium]|nr:hypothetical protein [Candidatus Polarisedimenticolaceae bacterium]